MEQMKALNALAPFLALTKSASSPLAAIDLITRATSQPGTFIFSELLQAPQIQALSTATSEQAIYLELLKIFSYGTYMDYTRNPSLPALNPSQTLKLRQLSFLTLAKNPSDLTYSNLLTALSLSTPRELEDLVISAIYAGLLTGTLDPYNQVISISSVSPLRDLPPNSIPSMLLVLSEWSSRCTSTLSDLERQIASIKAEALRRHRDEVEWAAHVEKLMENTKSGQSKESHEGGSGTTSGGGGFSLRRFGLGGGGSKRGNGDVDDLDMDVDEDMDDDGGDGGRREGLRSSKKRGGFLPGFGK